MAIDINTVLDEVIIFLKRECICDYQHKDIKIGSRDEKGEKVLKHNMKVWDFVGKLIDYKCDDPHLADCQDANRIKKLEFKIMELEFKINSNISRLDTNMEKTCLILNTSVERIDEIHDLLHSFKPKHKSNSEILVQDCYAKQKKINEAYETVKKV